MSRKARELAEAAADRAIRKMPVAYKAYGMRDTLVSMALPAAEFTVKMDKIIKRNDQSVRVLKRQSEVTDAALRQTETALLAVEAMHRNMTSPNMYSGQRSRVLDDFVIGSRPITKPEVNGHSPERPM